MELLSTILMLLAQALDQRELTHRALENFIMGAIAMACFVVGLFFLRFWRETRDRLFLIFALAFWLLGLTRLMLAWNATQTESHTYLYIVRLAAFALILLAIVDKNRPRAKAEA